MKLGAKTALVILCLIWTTEVHAAESAKILKVLPHLLDLQGRNALSPSLYERDAYQDFLRKNPTRQSALRFDIHWKVKGFKREPLRLRLEIRTSKEHFAEPLVLERSVRPGGWFGRWSALTIPSSDFQQMGAVVAWRSTLWSHDRLLAEQKSFLW